MTTFTNIGILGLTHGLIAGVSTLFSKGFLEEIDIVFVSAKQVEVVVKLHGVRHVKCDEVIIST